jgi:hypothetical protein
MRQLADGFRWVWGFAPARWLLAHLTVMSLTVPVYQAMVPLFASEIHHGDSRTQGLLVSSAGVGALIGTFLLAARPSVRGLVRVINAASAIGALGLITFAQTGSLPLACGGLVAVGFGIITTAAKRNQVDPAAYAVAVASMKQLNASAAQVAMRHGVVCMTDITGFGLLGHASEMVRDSDVAMQIHASQLPLLPTVRALADAGVVPGGLGRNRMHLLADGTLQLGADVPPGLLDIAVDPQTSGGLLCAVAPDALAALLADAHDMGLVLTVIGEVVAGRGVALVI